MGIIIGAESARGARNDRAAPVSPGHSGNSREGSSGIELVRALLTEATKAVVVGRVVSESNCTPPLRAPRWPLAACGGQPAQKYLLSLLGCCLLR